MNRQNVVPPPKNVRGENVIYLRYTHVFLQCSAFLLNQLRCPFRDGDPSHELHFLFYQCTGRTHWKKIREYFSVVISTCFQFSLHLMDSFPPRL